MEVKHAASPTLYAGLRMSPEVRHIEVVRADRDRAQPESDRVAVEEPLEVRLEGESFAVLMRTPGADADLVTGFLFHEGVIRSVDDLRRVEATEVPVIANVRLSRARAEILPDLLGRRRHAAANSSCGLCGLASLEALAMTTVALTAGWTIEREVVFGLPAALRSAQLTFAETGGLHAAGLFHRDGRLKASAEDVGRHNAVDKLIGRMIVERRLPLETSLLFVSGRTSFEIVQKAYLAGIPLVASVSAPSSLAVELAHKGGMTLLGFVRDARFNIYAHPARVR
jgi:FdhD protein